MSAVRGVGMATTLRRAKAPRHRPARRIRLSPEADFRGPRRGYRPAHAPTSPRRRPDRRRARGAVARPGAGRADRAAPRGRAHRARHHRPARLAPHVPRRGRAGRHRAVVPATPTASSSSATSRPSCSSTRSAPTTADDRRVIAVCAFALVTGAIGTTQSHPVLYEYVTTVFIVVGPTLVGRLARRQREQAERLRDLTDHLERERERTAHLAVDEERARIARELHDVVAHGLSVIAIQSDAAEAALDKDPALARAPLHAIRASAGEALGDMRRLLGVLREDQDGNELTPQPGLAQLGALIERARGAGVKVEVEEGEPRELPASLDLSAYRILQEALTNVRKHARGAPAAVAAGMGAAQLGCSRRPRRPAPTARARRRPRPRRHARAREGPRRRAARRHARRGRLRGPRDPPAAMTTAPDRRRPGARARRLPADPRARGARGGGEAGGRRRGARAPPAA